MTIRDLKLNRSRGVKFGYLKNSVNKRSKGDIENYVQYGDI